MRCPIVVCMISEISSCLHAAVLKSPPVSDAFNMLFTFPLFISRKVKDIKRKNYSIYNQYICQSLIIRVGSVRKCQIENNFCNKFFKAKQFK